MKFTYHIVNIKPTSSNCRECETVLFTYHIVNIKLVENAKEEIERKQNLHIT